MTVVSMLLYWLAAHPFLSWGAIMLLGALVAAALSAWRKNGLWWALLGPCFVFGMVNIFTGHIFNALFLNAYGIEGSGVVTHSEQTSSQLNDQYISAYDAVLRTADGQDVVVAFDDMSASIYPIRNEILVPPEGERFVTRYIQGFPRNFAIMSDLSGYGKRRLVAEDRAPVDKAAAQLAASPGNAAFVAEYRTALETFLAKHRHDIDPVLVRDYEDKLAALK